MIPIDLGSTILVLALIGGGMVLGLAAAVMAFAAQLPGIKHAEYTRGWEKGRENGKRMAFYDLATSDEDELSLWEQWSEAEAHLERPSIRPRT